MPLREQQSFIKDKKKDMTIREKNEQLSAELAKSPNVTRKISSIQRVEIGASGWWINYRVGRPD